ncbi:hypothetical protein ACTHQY_19305 [Rhodococcoides corynebacterioides]|uniref:hypothetical protein n=1 Tax=Rhodococcoides corynebacterioides TaxID=53972 RepID=UPI003F8238CD
MTRISLLTSTDPIVAAFGATTVDRSALTKGRAVVGAPNFLQSSTAFRSSFRAMTNIGDYVEYEEVLSSGTWSLVLETVTAASGGSFTVSVDGTVVSTISTYLASGGGATRTELAALSIPTTGKHLIRLTVVAKDAASSATTCRISGYTMTRTAA